MTKACRVSLAFALLVLTGCGGAPPVVEAAAPVAPVPTAPEAPTSPGAKPAVPANDAAAKDSLPNLFDVPLPEIFTPLLEERRKARDGLAIVLKRDDAPRDESSRALEADVNAMVRYYGLGFNVCKGFGEAERSGFLARIVREIKRDIGFYEANDLAGVVMRLRYELGRAHALAGDMDKACSEGFDSITEPGCCWHMNDWLEMLILKTYYEKAKGFFDVGRFEDTIAAVDNMFANIPNALNFDQGNGALLYKAGALMRRDPPDPNSACREAAKILVRANGQWPKHASQFLDSIFRAKEADAESVAPMTPEIMHGLAIGEVQLAYREIDAAVRRQHFERAVFWLRKTISATRLSGVDLVTRLKHESSAWFELGLVYSKMQLWYEASFAFEAVTRRFTELCVGRMLAKERGLQDALAEARRRIASGDVKPDDGDDPPSEHELLYREAAKTPEWAETLKALDLRCRKSANNLMEAARRSLRDSRSDLDRKRLDDLVGGDQDPEKTRDLHFHLGLLARSEAEGHAKRGETRRAVERWRAAAGLFRDAARKNEARRALGRHLAGHCLLEAAKATLSLAAREPGLRADAKRLGHEAYRAFEAFEQAAGPAGPASDGAAATKRAARLRSAAAAKDVIEKSFGTPPGE